MREEEFKAAYIKCKKNLAVFFGKLLKNSGYKKHDRATELKDLMQTTARVTLEEMDQRPNYPMEKLIFVKAKHVWGRHIRKQRRDTADLVLVEYQATTNRNGMEMLTTKDEINQAFAGMKKTAVSAIQLLGSGYSLDEIAESFGQSKDSLKMEISRERKKARNRLRKKRN